jgi:hypothetical protein
VFDEASIAAIVTIKTIMLNNQFEFVFAAVGSLSTIHLRR